MMPAGRERGLRVSRWTEKRDEGILEQQLYHQGIKQALRKNLEGCGSRSA